MDLQDSLRFETFRTPIFRRTEEKVTSLSTKDLLRKVIQASSNKKEIEKNISSKKFIFAEIPVISVAVVEDKSRFDIKAAKQNVPIVVDVNKHKKGKSAGNFIPPVIVIEGSGIHNAARFNGKTTIKAWIGCNAIKLLKIHADDQFGAQELNSKLSELLREKYVPKKKSGESIGPYPWIQEVYPFELYFVYSYEGKLYKQKFTTDIKKRSCKLDGDPTEVRQEYVDLTSQSSIEKAYNKFVGNEMGKVSGGFMYNKTSPGSGVGPRVNIPINPRSEAGGKLK
jgi:hypothetical protein